MLNPKEINNIRFVENPRSFSSEIPYFLSQEDTAQVRRLHYSLMRYCPTPLYDMKALASQLGLGSVLVKDESRRFGLKAFKGLGGIYAVFRAICEYFGLDPNTCTINDLNVYPDVRNNLRKLELVTATDGNHGKGVSWAAGMLGCRAHVFMPKGSLEVRAQAIRDAGGAEVEILDLGYDDAVRYADRMARERGWLLIQDTSWEGYEEVPRWIIQGYSTMVYESVDQMKALGYDRPTHVFLQAGVGAMAGGVLGVLRNLYADQMPEVVIAEPKEAACIYESIAANDGQPHAATGNGETIMAGLNCGEPCLITWPTIRDTAAWSFSCPDSVSVLGTRVLQDRRGTDMPVESGESGSVTTGLLVTLCTDPAFAEIRQKMGLDENSVVYLI
nr:diaminopropionate ammonia-lyase [Clostridia bacterium]